MKAIMSLRQKNLIAYCVKEKKPCIGWVNRYFKDCLCNLSDEFSFAFGLVSLFCWAVAEVPQIITNFRTKSSHGVSLLFLLGWVGGLVSFTFHLPFSSIFTVFVGRAHLGTLQSSGLTWTENSFNRFWLAWNWILVVII